MLSRSGDSLTELVGELLAHDGGGRAEARQNRHGERGADGQAVDEVVQRVAQRYHPRHRLDAGDLFPTQPAARHARRLGVLEERRDGLKALDYSCRLFTRTAMCKR